MPYRFRRGRSSYRGMNSYKATHPTIENQEQHYRELVTVLPAQTAAFYPWYFINDSDTNPNSQDDVKNTDKELGDHVSIGSRVNGIMASVEIKPTVITPQDLVTAEVSIGSNFIQEFLKRLDNTLDHFGTPFVGKTERDLYGDWLLSLGTAVDDKDRDVNGKVVYPQEFSPLSNRIDYFRLGQASVGFNQIREHTLYGWRPLKQRGFKKVPSRFKRVGLGEAFALFVWNRSDNPLNLDIFKSFKEYKEV